MDRSCTNCGATIPERYRRCGACGTLQAGAGAPAEVRRFATVVNSDLKGSTALGERLDPEALREVLNRYFDEMRAVFESHGGTIEKIIGDAIVAVFGLPFRHDDDAAAGGRGRRRSRSAPWPTLNDRARRRLGRPAGRPDRDRDRRRHVRRGDQRPARPARATRWTISTAMEQNAPPLEVLLAASTVRPVGDRVAVEAMEDVTPRRPDARAFHAYRLVVGRGASREAGQASCRHGRRRAAALPDLRRAEPGRLRSLRRCAARR